MVKVKGLTLLEIMMAITISLFLLSTFMILWVAMSKSSHKELKIFERNQDYIEAISYLRHVFSRAVYRPHCPNAEWLVYRGDFEDQFVEKIVDSIDRPIILYSSNDIVDGLQANVSKLLHNSSIVERFHFTPLVIVENSQIINVEDIKGARDGYILATDCRNYVIGKYQRDKRNDPVFGETLINNISNHLVDRYSVQYYKINHDLLYVINEHGSDQLVHNFLDGSNHMRLYGVSDLNVKFADGLDWQLLLFMMEKERFYIRLYNL